MFSMLSSSRIIAFLGTTDAERAKHFFGGTLGLSLLFDDSFALVYDCNGIMLRVARVPEVKPAGYTVLGWEVKDIEATVKHLTAAGVVFERFPGMPQDEHAIWSAPGGAKVAWFKDPDGNILSVSFHPYSNAPNS